MSLIVAIPTAEGVVLANDTSFAVGQSRDQVPKIFPLNSKIAWSGAGEFPLIQRVGNSLIGFQDANATLRELAAPVGGIIKGAVRELLTTDFRTEIYVSNFQALSQLHRVDLVLAEWSRGPQILHLNVFGSPVWIQDRPFALGSGDAFAGFVLNRYRQVPLTLRSATILAYRVLEEAIETGMFGLGGAVDVWQITASGLKQLNDNELAAIKEGLRKLKGDELALFEHYLSVTVSH